MDATPGPGVFLSLYKRTPELAARVNAGVHIAKLLKSSGERPNQAVSNSCKHSSSFQAANSDNAAGV